jgi:hypothetical protein
VDLFGRLKRLLIGGPRNLRDPHLFQKVSLVAFLAWVGLGADGLSSSAYGPDEAFRALGEHRELAVFLALATALTVFIITFAYRRMIEHFPVGGGYSVATKLLGSTPGVVAGGALLVDYVLTITVSIASGTDQVFSLLPVAWHEYKLPLEVLAVAALVVMNLRGVKESITVLLPIFFLFLVSHAVLLGGVFVLHVGQVPAVASEVTSGVRSGLSTLGVGGLLLILARAYARGAGTYTGIEAVSNAVQIMREPKVETAKRTMVYMAVSLAVVAGGILIGYMLLGVRVQEGKTLNAVLVENLGFGTWFVVLVLASEAALLTVAAQTGFTDGPRVMANMALDSWVPHRFSALSERLTLQDGVLLMGAAALATLAYTRGDIGALVTMYAINVFITFSLTQLAMCRFWVRARGREPGWRRGLAVHVIAAVLCVGILGVVVYEKFFEGAWLTLVVTAVLIGLCFLIRRYYRRVEATFARLSKQVESLPPAAAGAPPPAELDLERPTAAVLVGSFGGLGVHSVLTILRLFPNHYRQMVFVSVAVLDSGNFKGVAETERLAERTRESLEKYVALANRLGLAATSMMRVGPDPVAEADELCAEVAQRFPKTTFFAGKLIFQREKWYHRLLHNETAEALQRRLQWRGLPLLILPARVFN